jgi:hypothetical protein
MVSRESGSPVRIVSGVASARRRNSPLPSHRIYHDASPPAGVRWTGRGAPGSRATCAEHMLCVRPSHHRHSPIHVSSTADLSHACVTHLGHELISEGLGLPSMPSNPVWRTDHLQTWKIPTIIAFVLLVVIRAGLKAYRNLHELFADRPAGRPVACD